VQQAAQPDGNRNKRDLFDAVSNLSILSPALNSWRGRSHVVIMRAL